MLWHRTVISQIFRARSCGPESWSRATVRVMCSKKDNTEHPAVTNCKDYIRINIVHPSPEYEFPLIPQDLEADPELAPESDEAAPEAAEADTETIEAVPEGAPEAVKEATPEAIGKAPAAVEAAPNTKSATPVTAEVVEEENIEAAVEVALEPEPEAEPDMSTLLEEYKNPEYFLYHKYSFYDLHMEIMEHYFPQPSPKYTY